MLFVSSVPGLLPAFGQPRVSRIVSDEVPDGIWNGTDTCPLPFTPPVLPSTLLVLLVASCAHTRNTSSRFDPIAKYLTPELIDRHLRGDTALSPKAEGERRLGEADLHPAPHLVVRRSEKADC